MPNFSKFSAISGGAQRTVDLSNNSNILELGGGGLQMNGSTSGHIVVSASATTSTYSIVWPAAQAASAGYILSNDGTGVLSWISPPSTGVTSVALVDSTNTFNIIGSPVTSSGTFTITGYQTQSANFFLAAPDGSNGAPLFRAIVPADVPTLNQNTTGSADSVSGTNTITNANLTQMISLTIKGNDTGGTANASDLSVAQVNAILPVFTSSLNGITPSSGGGTSNFLRADGSWAAPTSGADAALSNLASVAINTSLLPGSDNSINLGSSSFSWATANIHSLKDASAVTSVSAYSRLLSDSAGNTQLTWSTSGITLGVANSLDGKLILANANTGDLITVKGAATSGSYNFNLPTTAGTSGYVLTSAGGGFSPMTWVNLATVYLALAGGTMSGAINMGSNSITNLAAPTNPNDAVTKAYVDNFINATSWKTAVVVATTANITLSGEQTIDGVLTSTSRVLVKNQSTTANNGVYVSASGAWTRAVDMDSWAEVPAAAIFVQSGTVNADLGFVCTSQPGGTLGTTAITFVQFSSAGAYSADGTTLQLVSGVFSVKNAGITETQIASSALSATGALSGGSGTKLSVNVDNSTIDISGNNLEVKALGITSAQLAAAAVTAAKLGSVTDGITTDQNGSGSTIEVLSSPSFKRILVAGQTFTANTSYAVRWGLTANSETAGRIYAADTTTSSFDLFYVIGMASSGTTVTAGNNITVTMRGAFNLGTSDTAFGSGTDGAPVFLTASGTFSTTPPSVSGTAVTKIGMVQLRSATAASNIIDVGPQVVGVN